MFVYNFCFGFRVVQPISGFFAYRFFLPLLSCIKGGKKTISTAQWCSRNSKSHFARNLLANRRTNSTLIVRLGAKITC